MSLEIIGLSKIFNGKKVVNDLSLELHRGEIVGLLGPNGAGKTTCFSMIAGLLKPDQGKIKIGNNDITNLPIYRRYDYGIAYLPQESSIFRGLTVEQNIMAILEIHVQDISERNKRLEELLGELGISHLKNSNSLSLSGGERRRLEIARTLALEPKFILLDEPFAGIDPIAISDIMSIINHLKSSGIGVLITDHNVRETLKIVDKAYIIYEGKVLLSGTANEIAKSEKVKSVYLGKEFSL